MASGAGLGGRFGVAQRGNRLVRAQVGGAELGAGLEHGGPPWAVMGETHGAPREIERKCGEHREQSADGRNSQRQAGRINGSKKRDVCFSV